MATAVNPQPIPAQVRTEFEELVIGDIHGPAFGPEETLPASPPIRDRYLVGMLAPRDVRVDPSLFDDPGNSEGQPEGAADVDRTATQGPFPSSIGLSFAVDGTISEIVVCATWGQYRKEERATRELESTPGFYIEKTDREREKLRVWQRYHREGTVNVPIVEGDLVEVTPVKEQRDVIVRGRARRTGAGNWAVTLFLVNEQLSSPKNIDERWLFQAALEIKGANDRPIFLERGAIEGIPAENDAERAQLAMLYRNELEFAVGHGTAAHVERSSSEERRAVAISTRNVPTFELARTDQPQLGANPLLSGVELDMLALSKVLSAGDLAAQLSPIVTAYNSWIDTQEERIGDPSAHLAAHEETAREAVAEARRSAQRIAAGIKVLVQDPNAFEAFRFMSEAMWQQRIRSVAISERRRATDSAAEEEGSSVGPIEKFVATADKPRNRSWRLFQLAFILLNLPSLVDPAHQDRAGRLAILDLLFFPTGGGKTEAYLGLVAFTLAIRRLQGTISSDDGPLDGSQGVAALMRYTLRLLTAQQFTRAAALICACEILRRDRVVSDARWGTTPFRLGLWIGQATTPNWYTDSRNAIEAARQRGHTGGYANPLQLAACPWCGTELRIDKDLSTDKHRWRTLVYCGDPLGSCAFTHRRSLAEGIPVVTVDEEIYRLLPAFLIATIDKFARLPRLGPMHLLFGRTYARCERHGFRSRDLDTTRGSDERPSHNAADGLPAQRTVSCARLRPPDLIIQDELHLISGPLGTLAGLYETAIDHLASVRVGEVEVRPKVVASTATIRRASAQTNAIFARRLAVFPPPVIDAGETFFSVQTPVSEKNPGRRYIGVCARGQRLKAAEARMSISILAAGQKIFDRYGEAADPYMTLLDYFSSLRELAGMRRLVDDDVRQRLPRASYRGLGRRSQALIIKELTSRMSSSEIPKTLDGLAIGFTPQRRSSQNGPFDVVLATNMVSVGVDVLRLGLMLVVGQPKATAEYIQATSRVGRDANRPGTVFTLYNWSRPRDLSHYERFEYDHATFYRQVEPISVTPFSDRALDRALTAVLVGLVRHDGAHRTIGDRVNPDEGAQVAPLSDAEVRALVEVLAKRAETVSSDAHTPDRVRRTGAALLDLWVDRQRFAQRHGALLSYEGDARHKGLLQQPGAGRWDRWTVPNSLRETEHEVNLLLTQRDATADEARPYVLQTKTESHDAPNIEDEESDSASGAA